jgi:hypothetical protein
MQTASVMSYSCGMGPRESRTDLRSRLGSLRADTAEAET